ncbi:MAG: SDR family oxidoreductase [Chlorobium sp.]|uniref:SDR family NAD(P)-dependent oxidoreductase n=1 Tax=Chlorobium sp. TaxID=1095 RepID=UPI002F42AB5A
METKVVITGSSRGIGFGLAEQFLKRGCRVALNGSTRASTDRALERLARYENLVIGVSADASRRDGLLLLHREVLAKFGSVDIWINNAGISHETLNAWELDAGAVERVLRCNIDGVVHGTIIAFLEMRKRGAGKIFNMEGFGSDGFMLDGMTLYGTTKRALTYFTRSFSHEARSTGVQVGTLSPGMVVTDLLRMTAGDDSPESLKKRKFFNVMADDVETVSVFLTDRMLAARDPSPEIRWLTKPRMLGKLLRAPFAKRDFFS